MALQLALCVATASVSGFEDAVCSNTQNGYTVKNDDSATVLRTFSCSDPAICCNACASDVSCSAWTLDPNEQKGICRTKAGNWSIGKQKSSAHSGLHTTSPPTLPPTLPTPPPVPEPKGLKNVVMILVDDLRPEIGAYKNGKRKTAITPNIDRLAANGTLFTRAYVQYSFCAPSRNSFMSGRRPDRTTCWNFIDHFREPTVGAKWTSMPQFFKEHGMLTLGVGKLFHPGLPPSADAPYSWSFGDASDPTNLSIPYYDPAGNTPAVPPYFANTAGLSGCVNKSGEAIAGDMAHWCAYNMTRLNEVYPEYNGEPLFDQQIASIAVSNLKAAVKAGNPFFLGIGFHRPHLPFAVPIEYHDALPPASEMPPPKYNRPPQGSPEAAWHPGGFCGSTYNQSCSDEEAQIYRRAYYAAVGYTDTNVGKVLDAIDSEGVTDNTVVMLMGDHGWQLGEMDEWRKMTNWELGVRVPLIFRIPWKAASHGVRCSALVEAVDLYPTLVSLAGLPDPTAGVNGYPVQNLQGNDISSYFDSPPLNGSGSIKSYAFSQFAKQIENVHGYGPQPWNPCTKCNRSDWDYMGYTLRSDRWRYTEWTLWNKVTLLPNWGEYGDGGGPELYDHQDDDGSDLDYATDKVNLAHDPVYATDVATLSKILRDHFQNDHDSA